MKIKTIFIATLVVSASFLVGCKDDSSLSIDIYAVNNDVAKQGIGEKIGVIVFSDDVKGLKISTNLHSLSSGSHGFHIHENPNCGPKEKNGVQVAALQAGGHFDPSDSKKHLGPSGEGHLGDLPALIVADDGKANSISYAPRLKVADLKSRSVIIHAAGDNYSDNPLPLGGGGARIACGVIP